MRSEVFIALAVIFFAVSTKATPVVTVVTNTSVPFTPFTVRNDDLLQTSLASVQASGNFTLENSGGVPILNNGQFTILGGGGNNPQLATAINNSSVVFNLNVSFSPLGYIITNITTYGGWNDSGRDQQLFTISYSLIGNSGFSFMDSINVNPSPSGPGQVATGVRAIFTASLTGVDAIRFDFPSGQENTYAGYAELDVLGAPLPEPGMDSLTSVGAALLSAPRCWRKERRRRIRIDP